MAGGYLARLLFSSGRGHGEKGDKSCAMKDVLIESGEEEKQEEQKQNSRATASGGPPLLS